MRAVPTAIADVVELHPARFADARGELAVTFNAKALAACGVNEPRWVQENQSVSVARGTVRGLHFQAPPAAQAKLVRAVKGAVLDVAVDLRRGSPSFGRHVAITLSAAGWNQLYIPAGFAHGFCTLEPDTEVLYKISQDYSPEHERGLDWLDPDLGIAWPVAADAAVLSERDCHWPRLRDLPIYF
ncbi:MAG: dTDP-4-dehydrorhamnose 3,5-epimerase [Rhodospirillaceae bacterium]|nr:dTDP-4-dehydrorhamnose 3,5-epimerase [Rhodospirillaceae bacterium]